MFGLKSNWRFALGAVLLSFALGGPSVHAGIWSNLVNSFRGTCGDAFSSSGISADQLEASGEFMTNVFLNLGGRIADNIERTSLAERYSPAYLDKLFKFQDKIYMFNGQLVRLRPSTGQVRVIPSDLESEVARAGHFR